LEELPARSLQRPRGQRLEGLGEPLLARVPATSWTQALELTPDNFSAREELARLAQQRDELDLAAAQYQAAWKLRPARRDLLVELARIWMEQRPRNWTLTSA